MKRFVQILLGLAALGAAESARAMPLGLRTGLWSRSARALPSVTLVFADGGAPEGSVPDPVVGHAGESVILPGRGTLAWPKHAFLGWSDGTTLHGEGTPYPLGGVSLMTAAWSANTLSAPVIAAPETYEAESCTVTITAEDGAAVYYTLDGSEPDADGAASRPYRGPFEVEGSATIKAVAVKEDHFDSAVATAAVRRLAWTFGEYLNWPGQTFTTGGDAGWTRAKGASADGYALRSGAIAHGQASRLETVVSGPGTVSFRWRASCEGYFVFRTQKILLDYLSFSVDGAERGLVNGETDWTNCVFAVEGEGEHVLAWSYIKDTEGSEGEDCAWLDGVTWTPSGTLTGLEAWLAERGLAADARAANGRTAAECYALGLDPADATNDFRIVSIEIVDGEPKVEWKPKVNRWTGAELNAALKGAAALKGDWKAVEGATPSERAAMRFFKVVVEP